MKSNTTKTMSYQSLTKTLVIMSLAFAPSISHATSASINVDGNEGAVGVSAEASFSTHTFCSGSGDNKKCWEDDTGTLSVKRDQYYSLGSKSGSKEASWSGVVNAGLLSQGNHTFYATARDSKGITDTAIQTIVVDNTPDVSIFTGKPEGDMHPIGTVDFNDNPEGLEGTVSLFINWENYNSHYWYPQGTKEYEGSDLIDWTWEEITDAMANAGKMRQGTHRLKVKGIAANGAVNEAIHEFTVDNTPEITISAGKSEGDMDAKGTVDFKDNPEGLEGRVSLFINWENYNSHYWYPQGTKEYEGSDFIDWTWEEITGAIVNAGKMRQGTHRLRARGTAINGTIKDVVHEFTVDNTPDVTILAGEPDGDMNAKGTADFKDNPVGPEGSVSLFIKWENYNSHYWYPQGTKEYEGSDLIDWTWEEIVGHAANAGTMRQGTHQMKVQGTAANGTIKEETHEFTIDNTPSVSMTTGQTDGDMMVKGTVDFKNNFTGDEGSVSLFIKWGNYNSHYWYPHGTKSYEGDELINWSWEEITGGVANSATMRQGIHLMKVKAIAANGAFKEEIKEFTVDNRPDVSIVAGATDGDMKVNGIVDFKDNPLGSEGSVSLFIKWENYNSHYWYSQGSKSYEGDDSINWIWEDVTGNIANAATMRQGTHLMKVRGTGANGVYREETWAFTIDNTPALTLTAGEADGDMKANGVVDFKDNPLGDEGTITLYIKWGNYNSHYWYSQGSKSYKGSDSTAWTWDEITGHILNSGTMRQGTHQLRAQGTAVNGTIRNVDYQYTVNNTPIPEIFKTQYFPDDTFDVFGKVTFKGNATGDEGTIALFVKADGASRYTQHGTTKSYEGKEISWKYSDFTGKKFENSAWAQKEFLLKVVATAANGTTASIISDPRLLPQQGGQCKL
jgi:hypothetical protein